MFSAPNSGLQTCIFLLLLLVKRVEPGEAETGSMRSPTEGEKGRRRGGHREAGLTTSALSLHLEKKKEVFYNQGQIYLDCGKFYHVGS